MDIYKILKPKIIEYIYVYAEKISQETSLNHVA